MRITSKGGEGCTARDAISALAFSVRDIDVGEEATITVKRATIRRFDETTYEGYTAEMRIGGGE